MSKTYRSEYTVAKGNAFTIIGAGNYLIARIRAAAPEGKLLRSSVRQAGGGPTAFSVDWFDSLTGPNFVPGEYNPAVTPLPSESFMDLYRIRPQVEAGAGGSATNLDDQAGYSFAVQDGGFSNRPREIYMLLQVRDPVANTVWELTVVTQDSVG